MNHLASTLPLPYEWFDGKRYAWASSNASRCLSTNALVVGSSSTDSATTFAPARASEIGQPTLIGHKTV